MSNIYEPQRERLAVQQAPDMPLKERQRQEREALILRAAMDLLINQGYHETSMEEIASRVGISKGAVYLHFPSKEDLIAALFERGARSLSKLVGDILSSSGSPSEKLSLLIEQVYGNMGKRFQLMSAIMQHPELQRLLAAKHETMAALWAEPSRRVAAVIDEGKALGEFDTELQTALVVSLLWSLLSPHGYQQLIVRDGMPINEVIQGLRRYFLRGISARATVAGEGESR